MENITDNSNNGTNLKIFNWEIGEIETSCIYAGNMISLDDDTFVKLNKIKDWGNSASFKPKDFDFNKDPISEECLYLVFGETASKGMYEHTKGITEKKIYWISLLASNNFDATEQEENKVPKFWFSPDYELSLLSNFIFDNRKDEDKIAIYNVESDVNNENTDEYAKPLYKKFRSNFNERYSKIEINEITKSNIKSINEKFNCILILGLGGEKHQKQISECIENYLDSNGFILTNLAIKKDSGLQVNKSEDKTHIDVLKAEKERIVCVDINQLNNHKYNVVNGERSKTNKENQYIFIELAIEMLKSVSGLSTLSENILGNKYYETEKYGGVGFDNNGYLTFPLTVQNLDNKNVFEPDILKERNSYELANFIKKINENTVKLQNNTPEVSFTPSFSFKCSKCIDIIKDAIREKFEAVNLQFIIAHNTNINDSNVCCIKGCNSSNLDSNHIRKIFDEYLLFKEDDKADKRLLPIQINLWEEDAPDNDAYRLCINGKNQPLAFIRNFTDETPQGISFIKDPYSSIETIKPNNKINPLDEFKEIVKKTVENEQIKYAYIIPYGASRKDSNSCLALTTKKKLRYPDLQLLQAITNQLFPIYHDEIARKELRNESIKSAIAAIMSRNMSHNLGSHVFFYTRQNLLDIYNKEKDKDAFEYTSHLKGLSWFLHYVQERQDFIANINSGDEYHFGQLNLKQDIIDEIAPDALDRRHLSGGEKNRLDKITRNFLLKNIVRSEKITHYSTDYETDGSLKDLQIIVNYNGNSFKTNDMLLSNNDFYSIDFAVQGGQQSRHAFLVLLENIIRNSAKHAFPKSINKESLIITIDVALKGNEYEILIYDNTKNARIKDNKKNTNIDFLKEKLNNLKLLDEETGTINKSNKGLKEMLVSILWLKGKDFDRIEEYAKDKSILEIVENDGNIAYKFTLPEFKKRVELNLDDCNKIKSGDSLGRYGLIYVLKETKYKKELKETLKTQLEGKSEREVEEILNENLTKDKEEFTKRIPRFIVLSEGSNETDWQILYEKYIESQEDYKNNKKYLLFDRASENQNSKHDQVHLKASGEQDIEYLIHFNNHLTTSMDTMSEFFGKIEKKHKIYESISGANQAFNLMQKFILSKSEVVTDDVKKSVDNLYWNILLNYQTKIVIVDERLSYSKEEASNEKNILEKFKNQQNTFVFNLDADGRFRDSTTGIKNVFTNYLYDSSCDTKTNAAFFTIHLGLIDKFRKDEKLSIKDKIKIILETNNLKVDFVCVHSGRGGIDKDENNITFIPFSILQRCFEDSKFLLSEFFYNNIYTPIE